eukprot:1144307-Pelagomonas_calceolata.AAC.2
MQSTPNPSSEAICQLPPKFTWAQRAASGCYCVPLLCWSYTCLQHSLLRLSNLEDPNTFMEFYDNHRHDDGVQIKVVLHCLLTFPSHYSIFTQSCYLQEGYHVDEHKGSRAWHTAVFTMSSEGFQACSLLGFVPKRASLCMSLLETQRSPLAVATYRPKPYPVTLSLIWAIASPAGDVALTCKGSIQMTKGTQFNTN